MSATKIPVDFHIGSIFRDWVYVDRKSDELHECYEHQPVRPVNKPYEFGHICSECGAKLTRKYVDNFNRYYGYSGYDE